MLRDVVVHIHNEQPILADLAAEPTPADVALICRNVRTMNGTKPVFVDKADSAFVIPLAHVRFIEIPQASIEASAAETAAEDGDDLSGAAGQAVGGPLARLAWLTGMAGEPPGDDGSNAPAGEASPVRLNPDGLDDDLLRRIREA